MFHVRKKGSCLRRAGFGLRVLLFVIVKSVLSGLQRAGSLEVRLLGDVLKWPIPIVLEADRSRPGQDEQAGLYLPDVPLPSGHR
jgi:hypothetical protein